jgi:hypothetical protein
MVVITNPNQLDYINLHEYTRPFPVQTYLGTTHL